ncbi:T9SS type A sorting domain-containing protein [Fulvivirga sp. 29W222]|uniref:T9SS type A sorting domain-containing protein n=1 Tax=Fulvivirga marina TaxID=2494733 RepID=A0A937FXW4_9BACT|nr:T9SS type A sorting domain-containing protein [Fulvivirga marina]MBL6448064.1 T9SS type A sorting domain-containing protein [Fulvivirga marina]
MSEKLSSENPYEDSYGYSIDVYQNIIVVGAMHDDTYGEDAGLVYVYERVDGAWGKQCELISDDINSKDQFGTDVAIFGDYIIIGANQHGDGKGAVYFFKKNGDCWEQINKFNPDNHLTLPQFGSSVSIFGNYAVIGAIGGGGMESGEVYIFQMEDSNWGFVAKILSPVESLRFGYALKIYEDFLIIGGSSSNTGYTPVFIYQLIDGKWELDGQLDSGVNNDWFGRGGVEINDSYAIVSASRDSQEGENAGAFYTYIRTGEGWQLNNKVTVKGRSSFYLGYGLALQGDNVFVGANGSVLLYQLNETGVTYMQELKSEDSEPGWFVGAISATEEILLVNGYDYYGGQNNVGTVKIFTNNVVNGISNENYELSISPNPVVNRLVINNDSSITISSITVRNELGHILLRNTNDSNQVHKVLDLHEFPSGVYYIQVVSDKFSIIKKIVKK